MFGGTHCVAEHGPAPGRELSNRRHDRSNSQGWFRLLVIAYLKAIKSVRLSVTDFGFNGSFVRLALPEFKTL